MKWQEQAGIASSLANNILAEYCDREQTNIEPLRKITMVGAIAEYNNGQFAYLSENDFYYLKKTLNELYKARIPISPDFKINVVNLNEGRNFLNEKDKTDLLIICNLPPEINGKEYALYKSDNADKSEWSERIKESEAKIIVNIGWNKRHLSDEIFKNSIELLSGEDRVLRTDYNGSSKSIEMQYSIATSPSYFREIEKHINEDTNLEKNAKNTYKALIARSRTTVPKAPSPHLPQRK